MANNEHVNMITYGVPVPFNSSNPYGTLLFLINEEVIDNMLSNVVGSTDGFAYILNSEGEIIADYNGLNYDSSSLFQQLQKNEEVFQEMTLDNQQFYVSHVKSAYQDWYYIAVTPESHLMANVTDFNNKVLISYIIILLVGFILILFTMKINYQPLRRLIQKAEESIDIVSNRSGIDKVIDVIKQSVAKNETLSEQVERSEPIIQQHLFSSLLCGEIPSYQSFNELGTEVDLKLHESSYFVMLFDIEETAFNNLEKKELVKSWLSPIPNKEKHIVYLLESSTVASIISGEVDYNYLNKWYEDNIRYCGFTVTIGVGNSYSEAKQIGKSHLEASSALDYKLIRGHDKIIFFCELASNEPSPSWYDKQIIEELEYHIRKKNKLQVEKSINEVLKIIKRKNSNLFMAKCLIFDVSSTLIKMVDDIKHVSKQSTVDLPDILQINDFRSVSDIEERLQTMIEEVYKLYDNIKDKKSDLLHQLIEFIDNNYQDYHFSTQTLAEHFSLSEAYIMRYFKKHTGKTILQYLTKQRIDRAKQLLVNTDIAIKDIVTEVGYGDVSSFIRRFKKETKYTPGEYRKNYQHENEKKFI